MSNFFTENMQLTQTDETLKNYCVGNTNAIRTSDLQGKEEFDMSLKEAAALQRTLGLSGKKWNELKENVKLKVRFPSANILNNTYLQKLNQISKTRKPFVKI